jgi:HD-like signal output (HDOD) protein
MTAFYKDFEPEDLPVPGKQVMHLIQYTLREDASMETLSRLISVNPALTAQLLRLVNSAFFGFRHRIRTISEAVVALGLNSLRNFVLCFAVKEALSKKEIPGFDEDSFWEDSIRRGVAARRIGILVKGPVEEAFTAGMFQDIGLLVLFSMEPEKADRWPLLRSHLPGDRHKMEEELFHAGHDSVGALLAHQWNLPKSYALAMDHHHRLFSEAGIKLTIPLQGADVLAGMLHLSDWCNAFYTCHDKSGALMGLKRKAGLLFGLTEDEVESLLSLLPDLVMEISNALSLTLGNQPGFDSIMKQAGQKLVEDNISYQELTWRLQRSLKERDVYASGLKKELDTAREIQKGLQPEANLFSGIRAFNIPASYLSGDFFDYFQKEDGRIYFCLGDVSGKGTGAALLMAKAVSMFRCLCRVVTDISTVVR